MNEKFSEIFEQINERMKSMQTQFEAGFAEAKEKSAAAIHTGFEKLGKDVEKMKQGFGNMMSAAKKDGEAAKTFLENKAGALKDTVQEKMASFKQAMSGAGKKADEVAKQKFAEAEEQARHSAHAALLAIMEMENSMLHMQAAKNEMAS